MNMSKAELRDQIVALLVLLDETVHRRMPEATLRAGLDILRGGWLRSALEHEDADAVLKTLPGWLTVGSKAGLVRILSAATEENAKSDEAAMRVVSLLDEGRLWELVELAYRIPDVVADLGGSPSADGAPPLTAIMRVRDRYVAITLYAVAQPYGTDGPWDAPMDWASRCMAAAATAVQDLLRSFESLAYTSIERTERYRAAWPTQSQTEDPGVTLAIGLDMLAEITGLGRPADILATGAWVDDGYFHPLEDAEIQGRLAAVRHITHRILAPTVQGWVVAGPGDSDIERLPEPGTTLDGAAEALWGEAWLTWKREQHRAELAHLGWVTVPWAASRSRGGLPETRVSQVDALDVLFRVQPKNGRSGAGMESGNKPKAEGVHRRVAVLGGPASSGKSVIVRLLAARITTGKHPWNVQVIAPISGELPDRHVAVQAGRHALGMLGRVDHRHCLLVLEDLLPIGEGAANTVLLYLSEALGVSVLGVLQYDMNSGTEWATDAVDLIPAIVGKPDLRAFVDLMAWAHPDLVDREAGLTELRRPGGTRDVGRLARVMLRQPDEDGDPEARSRTLRQQLLALDACSQQAVATVAAASLTRGGVEASLLSGLAEEALMTFGIEQFRQADQQRISSQDDSWQVLTYYFRIRQPDAQDRPSPSRGQVYDLIVELLLPLVVPALLGGLDSALTQLRGARLYHSRVCTGLLRATWRSGALRRWLSRASAITLARFLLGLTTSLDDDVTAAAVREIVARIDQDPTPMSLHDLVVMVRVLRECVSTDTVEFRRFAYWLNDQVSAVISRGEGTPDERLNLLRRVVWFQDPELNGLITERIVEIVDRLDPLHAADYYIVPQVQRLQIAAEKTATEESVRWPVEREDSVRKLLDYDPPQDAPFHILAAHMLLRRQVLKEEWWPMLDKFEHRFPRALKGSSPRDVTRSLQEIRHSRPMQRHSLLKRATVPQSNGEYLRALRVLFGEASPMEAVEMLHAMYMLFVWAPYLMLYRDDDTANEGLADALAKKVKTRNDVRAAGMLLSTCRFVEDAYYITGDGFSLRFGQSLGLDWVTERLERDQRPSAKYYLVKGLWEAQVPFREQCLGTVLDVTAHALTQSRRVWGPRLALQIGLDPDIGPRFLSELRGKVSVNSLLRGMSSWSPPDAQVQFHRLGRALFPEIASRFAREFDLSAFAERLGNAAPTAAAECCQEVLRTLEASASPVDGPTLFAAADQIAGVPGAWAARLDRVPSAEGFAQTLNILSRVDLDGARRVTETYSARLARRSDQGDQGSQTRLVRKLRHAMFDSAVAATGMLSALERAAGLGLPLYEQLIAEEFLMLIFTGELQMSQSVSEQYIAASHLARIGIGPDSPFSQWMSPVYRSSKLKAKLFSSPKALVEILWTLELWKEEWAYDVAHTIDYPKLTARLSRGLMTDVMPAIDLAAVVLALDNRRGAEQLLNRLGDPGWEEIVDRIGLAKGAVLLRLVKEAQPQAVLAVGQRMNAMLAEILSQVAVVDDNRMWMDIGQACHALVMAGIPVQPLGRPPARRPNLIYAPALAWGLQHMPHVSWRHQLFEAAMSRIVTAPITRPTSLICSLAAASHAGRLDDLLAVTPDISPVLKGSLQALADLYETAESQPKLAAALQPYREELNARLQVLPGSGAWHRRRLAHSLIRHDNGKTLGEAG